MLYAYPLYIFLTPIILTQFHIISAYSLLPRKSVDRESYDPWIICEGAGPTHAEGLPPAYSENNYRQNIDLCSSIHGVYGHNVGCFCAQARGNVHCVQRIADSSLWNALFTSSDPEEIADARDRGFADGRMPFWEYCWGNCLCADLERARAGIEDHGNISGLRLTDPTRTSVHWIGSTEDSSGINLTAGTVGAGNGYGTIQAKEQPEVQSKCGNNCTTDQDCKNSGKMEKEVAGLGSNCTCRTQSSQYQPGIGTFAFVSACLIDMSIGGKRDEKWPCPCNSSYVSHGCCGANAGLVWEAHEFKLGELAAEQTELL